MSKPEFKTFRLDIEYAETRVFDTEGVELVLRTELLSATGEPTEEAIRDALRVNGAADALGHNYCTDPGELEWRTRDDKG